MKPSITTSEVFSETVIPVVFPDTDKVTEPEPLIVRDLFITSASEYEPDGTLITSPSVAASIAP